MHDAKDVLEVAKKRYKVATDAWGAIVRAAREDLDFLSDEDSAQWDAREYNSRATIGRPAIQVDQLTQYVHQVVNDIRMNTPTIDIIPADLESDPDTAEFIAGRIKAIEYKSNADSAYDTAIDFSVKSSLGFIRVDRKYVTDESFEQELCIRRVVNPLSIYIDPESIEADGSDAKWGFVLEEMSLEEFKDKWPDATAMSFGNESKQMEKDQITIAEYFYIDEKSEEYGQMADGGREKAAKGKKYSAKRKVKKRVVHHCKLAFEDILEETTFPGKYIPLVPVYGEEAWRDGKRYLYSLIRKAKQSQMMFNLQASLELESLMKQQQAPMMAAVGQLRGFEDDYRNPDKAMVLFYHTTDAEGNQAAMPQRMQPPMTPTGNRNAKLDAVDNIKATLGMYSSSSNGTRFNATSGKQELIQQQQGDTATYHFGDNLTKSITHVGKIILCALPEVEDTARMVTMVDKEENYKIMGVNGAMAPEQERSFSYSDKYDVRVTTGAPFATQRQEAAQMYTQLIQSMPELMPIIGDLVFKYQDSPGSKAISERLKKTIDPKFLEEDNADPAAAMQQQMMQMQQEAQQIIAQLQQELQSKQGEQQLKAEIERGKLQLEAQKLKIDMHNAQKEPAPQTNQQPASIKLDTTGFQMMKTPEQEAFEMEQSGQQMAAMQQQQLASQMQAEMEAQAKAEQTMAVINALGSISQQLASLTATVSQPISVVRDEQGNLIGAQ